MSRRTEIIGRKHGLCECDQVFAQRKLRRPAQILQFVVLKKTIPSSIVEGNESGGYAYTREKRRETTTQVVLLLRPDQRLLP